MVIMQNMTLDDDSLKGWNYWEDLPPEKEEELLEKMATFIVNHGLEIFAELVFGTVEPVGRMGAHLGLTLFGPYFEVFNAATYTAVFRKRGNIKRLLERIRELQEEKK